jgi:GH15 family glucan-1,4-alpha-glucosidase
LLHVGFSDEARAWREWLVRAVVGTGEAADLYGVTGERRIDERELE